jgi:hypothetical protein
MRSGEAGENVREMHARKILGRAKPHRAGNIGLHEARASLVAEPQHLAGIGEQDLAVRRDLQLAARLPLEQPPP